MNKVAIGALVFVALIGGLVAILFLGGEEASAPATSGQNSDDPVATEAVANNAPTANTVEADTPEESITEADVAARATSDECWTIINGSVYDITAYIPRHPGGNEILAACGTDGTSLFTERTTENGEEVGSGTPHSSGASAQLENFKIGELAN